MRSATAAHLRPRPIIAAPCLLAALVCALLLLGACGGDDPSTAAATAPPVITPPAALDVQRGLAACYVSQHAGADIPAVKGYRLAAVAPLPDGITAKVNTVRFVGVGSARVLEAEVCFQADAGASPGPHEARLELRLYNADAEKLSFNDRLQPVRVLPITQLLQVH